MENEENNNETNANANANAPVVIANDALPTAAEKQAKKDKKNAAIRVAVDEAGLDPELAEQFINDGLDEDEVEFIIEAKKDKNFKRSPQGEVPEWVEFTLPYSGGVCRYVKAQGKHIRRAQTLAGTDSSKMGYALTAQTLYIDGRMVRMEDIDEMDEDDVMAIMKHKANFKLGRKI